MGHWRLQFETNQVSFPQFVNYLTIYWGNWGSNSLSCPLFLCPARIPVRHEIAKHQQGRHSPLVAGVCNPFALNNLLHPKTTENRYLGRNVTQGGSDLQRELCSL